MDDLKAGDCFVDKDWSYDIRNPGAVGVVLESGAALIVRRCAHHTQVKVEKIPASIKKIHHSDLPRDHCAYQVLLALEAIAAEKKK